MSWQITISQAKPNPSGKDTNRNSPLPAQLLGEWVDLKNTGDTAVQLSVLNLAHTEFGPRCAVSKEAQIYWTGDRTTLQPGQTVRVHAGQSVNAGLMPQVDRTGADHHAYTGSSVFVLNNDCGDNLSVWWKTNDNKWHSGDRAHYWANPPEGRVLQRIGNELR